MDAFVMVVGYIVLILTGITSILMGLGSCYRVVMNDAVKRINKNNELRILQLENKLEEAQKELALFKGEL